MNTNRRAEIALALVVAYIRKHGTTLAVQEGRALALEIGLSQQEMNDFLTSLFPDLLDGARKTNRPSSDHGQIPARIGDNDAPSRWRTPPEED